MRFLPWFKNLTKKWGKVIAGKLVLLSSFWLYAKNLRKKWLPHGKCRGDSQRFNAFCRWLCCNTKQKPVVYNAKPLLAGIKRRAREIHIQNNKNVKIISYQTQVFSILENAFYSMSKTCKRWKIKIRPFPLSAPPPLKKKKYKIAKTQVLIKIEEFFCSGESSCYYLLFTLQKFWISHYNGS